MSCLTLTAPSAASVIISILLMRTLRSERLSDQLQVTQPVQGSTVPQSQQAGYREPDERSVSLLPGTSILPGANSRSVLSGRCREGEGSPLATCPGEAGTVASDLGAGSHSLPQTAAPAHTITRQREQTSDSTTSYCTLPKHSTHGNQTEATTSLCRD